MDEEFKFSIHEYTFIHSENELKHSSHKTNFAKNTIRTLVKNEPDYTKVFLVLNGYENQEEAYVFEKKVMMRVFSYDAIKAVEIIACLPFYQYSNQSLIAQLTESLYITFLNKPDEDENPF